MMQSRWRLAAIILAASAAGPAFAQDSTKLRVDKLEKEMKAVQRVVFPNGQPVESEINAASGGALGTPSASPVADLTARVDALEAQLKSLTGQVEQDGFRLKKLEDSVKLLEARATTTATTGPVPAAVKPAAIAPEPAKPAASSPAVPKLAAPKVPTTNIKPATPAKPDPKRQAMIDKVELPVTDDATEDAYSYGYRLWQAKLYPEAQAKLREFATKYPNHRRASYAQNLLGRAYLDEGKPGNASRAFYANYKNSPKGERASESLYWLGISLMKLNEKQAACDAYKEFNTVYGGSAPVDLKGRVAKGQADAQCAG